MNLPFFKKKPSETKQQLREIKAELNQLQRERKALLTAYGPASLVPTGASFIGGPVIPPSFYSTPRNDSKLASLDKRIDKLNEAKDEIKHSCSSIRS